ncbi:hypothetical protein HA402_014611 [Bradysia odoriphaga]|nr:hypothetical protein HA402_014611 [Bradysia odoriphaga]
MDILQTFLMLSAVVVGSRSENGLSAMPKCRHEDKECIINVCNAFFQLSANGIPEVGLVPTNPYEIKNVNVETGGENTPINLKIQFKRANVTGISDYKINKIIGFEKDPRKSKFEMFGSVKLASLSGPYRISGKFLLLPVSGNGHANIFFGNLHGFNDVVIKVV